MGSNFLHERTPKYYKTRDKTAEMGQNGKSQLSGIYEVKFSCYGHYLKETPTSLKNHGSIFLILR
jgi:hypothetical protein